MQTATTSCISRGRCYRAAHRFAHREMHDVVAVCIYVCVSVETLRVVRRVHHRCYEVEVRQRAFEHLPDIEVIRIRRHHAEEVRREYGPDWFQFVMQIFE